MILWFCDSMINSFAAVSSGLHQTRNKLEIVQGIHDEVLISLADSRDVFQRL